MAEIKKPVLCAECRTGEANHDACYIFVEVDREQNPVFCACFDNDHKGVEDNDERVIE